MGHWVDFRLHCDPRNTHRGRFNAAAESLRKGHINQCGGLSGEVEIEFETFVVVFREGDLERAIIEYSGLFEIDDAELAQAVSARRDAPVGAYLRIYDKELALLWSADGRISKREDSARLTWYSVFVEAEELNEQKEKYVDQYVY
jgi:hypothetical protein